MSKQSINRPELFRVLRDYYAFATNGRALTQSAGQRREQLRAQLCKLTGEATYPKALKVARRLKKRTATRLWYRSRKERAKEASETAPGLATPRPFDAARVRRVLSSSIETNRRRH